MNVLVFLNEKGGTAKTSTSVALATLMAQTGRRVLLIDADSQGHATLATRLPREDRLYHLIHNNAPFKEVLVPVPAEYTGQTEGYPLLWVIPSAEGTALLNDKTIDPYILKVRGSELIRTFDVAIVDTSPTIGHLHLMSYLFAEFLIYPTEMTYLPIQGLFASFKHLRDMQSEYQTGQILGILPTRYRAKLKIQKQNLAALQKQYTEAAFFSPLKFLAAWDEANQLRLPINRLPYDHEAAPEAERFMKEVIDRMEAFDYARQET